MDRLHVHLTCVRPDVIDALRAMRGQTTTLHFAEANGIEFTFVWASRCWTKRAQRYRTTGESTSNIRRYLAENPLGA
jgi:CDP-diacylglycerol pyrophosphatase